MNKACCLFPVYFVISFWFMKSRENPASWRSDVGNRSRLFSAVYGNLGVFSFDFNKATFICDLKQLILSYQGQSGFTWLIHKCVADLVLPSSGVFCAWKVMFKLFESWDRWCMHPLGERRPWLSLFQNLCWCSKHLKNLHVLSSPP